MFGFFKELVLIGQLASGFGQIVRAGCSKDHFSSLSNGTKNLMIDNALKLIRKIHNYEFKTQDEVSDVFPDFVVCAYVLLAKEIFPKDAVAHLDVINGMMKTINNSSKSINKEVLKLSAEYLKEHKIG